jgi:hypothetical protein
LLQPEVRSPANSGNFGACRIFPVMRLGASSRREPHGSSHPSAIWRQARPQRQLMRAGPSRPQADPKPTPSRPQADIDSAPTSITVASHRARHRARIGPG